MRKRMFLSFATVLLVFCLLSYWFVLQTVYNMVCDNLILTSSEAMTRWSNELSNAMTYGRRHILNLSVDRQLQGLLRNQNGGTTPPGSELTQGIDDELREKLNQFVYSNNMTVGDIPFLLEITLRVSDGGYLSVYYSSRPNQTGTAYYALDDPWIQELEQRQGQFLWDTYSNSSTEYLRVSKLIYDTQDNNRVLGTISLDFSYEHIALSILNRMRAESNLYAVIYDSANNKVVGYYTLPILEEIDVSQIGAEGCQVKIDGEQECLFARRLGNTDFYLVGTRSLQDATTTYQKARIALLASAGIALILGMGLALLLTRRVMRPVVDLSQTMKDIKNGDLDITVQTRESGEIGELYNSFNYMIQMINTLIQENYVSRLNEKQSELNALQSQINTHFLYNTLDTINWLAKDYHASDISRLVTSLSTLLRISLNNGNMELTVAQELNHARSYLNIQQIRFAGLFDVREEIDDSILGDTVIKMLLQPLIENAILHAFNQAGRESNSNLLILRVQEDHGYLLLQVSNNAGPEDLAEATARLNNDRNTPSKSYGIQSIKNRLDISYEGCAQYFYTMDQNRMLTATIRIPRRYTRPDGSCRQKIKGVAPCVTKF